MGRDKALLAVGSETLLERIHRAASEVADEVLIAGRTELPAGLSGAVAIPDMDPGAGPLRGFFTGLVRVHFPSILLLACDHPYPNVELWRWLLRSLPGHDAVVPRREGQQYPLQAAYSGAVLPAVEACLQRDELRVNRFLRGLRVRWIEGEELAQLDPDGTALLNLNTPEDARALQSRKPLA